MNYLGGLSAFYENQRILFDLSKTSLNDTLQWFYVIDTILFEWDSNFVGKFGVRDRERDGNNSGC